VNPQKHLGSNLVRAFSMCAWAARWSQRCKFSRVAGVSKSRARRRNPGVP
jgi:hypothetical protein